MPYFDDAGKPPGVIPASMKPADLQGALRRLMNAPHESCAHLLMAWAAECGEEVKCIPVKGGRAQKLFKLLFPRCCRRVKVPATGDFVLLKNGLLSHVGVYVEVGDEVRVLHAGMDSPAFLEPLARLESRMKVVGFYCGDADVARRELAEEGLGEAVGEPVSFVFFLVVGLGAAALARLFTPAVPEYSNEYNTGGAAGSSHSLNAPGNRQTPFAPPPVAAGEYLMYPVLASVFYKNYSPGQDGRDKENLYGLLDFGMGDIAVDDIKLGDTDAIDFPNLSIAPFVGDAITADYAITADGFQYDLVLGEGWQAFSTTEGRVPGYGRVLFGGRYYYPEQIPVGTIDISQAVDGVRIELPVGCAIDVPSDATYTTTAGTMNVYAGEGVISERNIIYADIDQTIRIVYAALTRPTFTIRRLILSDDITAFYSPRVPPRFTGQYTPGNPDDRRKIFTQNIPEVRELRGTTPASTVRITAVNSAEQPMPEEGRVVLDGAKLLNETSDVTGAYTTRTVRAINPIYGLAFNVVGEIYSVADNGDVEAQSSAFDLQVDFKKGAGWQNISAFISAAAIPAGFTVSGDGYSVRNADRDPVRVSLFTDAVFPADVRELQVRMRRRGVRNDDISVKDELVIASVQARQTLPALVRENQNIIGFTATADDILNGRVERVNARVRAKCPIYQNNAWTADNHFTSNPAAWMRYFLRGLRDSAGALQLGAGLAAEQINDAELATWYIFCVAHNLRFDAVFERTLPISEMAQRIAAAGRALVSFASGKAGVVPLGPNTAPVLALSAANIKKDSLKINFSPRRAFEGIEAVFRDGAKEYQQETLRETMPGVLRPERFRRLDLFGVTQRAQAVKAAKLAAARMRYSEPFKYSFQLSNMELAISAGDVVTLEHDLLGAGAGVLRLRVDAVEFRESGVRVSASPDPAELYTAF